MNNLGIDEKRNLIDKNNNLSIEQQCKLLGISRSTYYYKKQPFSDFDLLILNLIDRIHTFFPVYGSRRLKVEINNILRDNKLKTVNRKRIQKYMRLLGIETIYQKPNLSKLGTAEYIYPYLLKGLKITKPNQVWSSDITYIPFKGGFIYLYGIIDWYSRTIIAYNISTTLKNDFVIDTIKEAFEQYGVPEIMNSDQGSHFTSKEYIDLLKEKNINISMDGKARALDNILIERFWRTIKYEYLFLRDNETLKDIEICIYNAIYHYNYYRPHQSLDYKYPMQYYNINIYNKNKNGKKNFNFKESEYNLFDDIKKQVKKYKKEENYNINSMVIMRKLIKKHENKMEKFTRNKKLEKILKS